MPDLPNITVTHPLKILPNSLAAGRRFNEAVARRHIRRVARRLGIKNPVLWLNPHSAVHMAGRMGERAVIYDITDDWTQLTQSPSLTQLTTEQDAELCRRADAVIVCSQKLFDLKHGLSHHLHLIPNGVDAKHYDGVLNQDKPLPDDAKRWPKPVLGYTGTIHPDRVDIALVEAIARKLSQGSIVLLGPNHLSENDKSRLVNSGKVMFKEAVPYTQLPEYMRAFDVCITPHCMTAFTESLNPIKLWEYLAAGKPIVSTNVAGFRDYPDFVYLAHDADSFVVAVQNALREGSGKPEARRAEARSHSWESRLDAVEAVIQLCLGKPGRNASNVR